MATASPLDPMGGAFNALETIGNIAGGMAGPSSAGNSFGQDFVGGSISMGNTTKSTNWLLITAIVCGAFCFYLWKKG